ncbi:MAG TPA: pitrilysin family protein, partial [Candidatus Eisenbacteria bacterium]
VAAVVRKLDNGLQVAVLPEHRLPIVHLQVLVEVGTAEDPPEQSGVAGLTASTLLRGTTSRSAEEFAAAIDALGGSTSGGAGREYSTWSGSFLSRDFEAGLELVADAVLHPSFTRAGVDRLKDETALALLASRRNADRVADEHLWGVLMAGHPYAHPPGGALETVPGLRRQQIQEFYQRWYRPDRARIAIVGDVDVERAIAAVEEVFGAWAGRAPDDSLPPAPKAPETIRIRLVDQPGATRAEIRIGFVGPGRNADDFYSLSIVEELLGAGPESRLKSRLGSDARALFTFQRRGAVLSTAASAPKDSVVGAIESMRSEIEHLVHEPPAAAEIDAARTRLQGAFALSFETLASLAAQWMNTDFFGLPADYVERYPQRIGAVSAADVQSAAAHWLDLEHSALVVVGPAAELEPKLKRWGAVETVSVGAAPIEVPVSPTMILSNPTAADRERGRKLCDLAVAAHGGLARIRKIVDSTVESEMLLVTPGGDRLPGTLREVRKDPFRFIMVTEFGRTSTFQALEGDRGWAKGGAAGDSILDQDSLGVASLRAGFSMDPLHLLLAAADPTSRVAFRGREPVAKHEAEVVEVVTADGERRVLFFDPQSHRMVAVEENEGPGPAPVLRRIFDDFRPVQGIVWPWSEERLVNGETAIRLTVQRVDLNGNVPDDLFHRPTDKPSHPHR